jgi:hypothetical protein
LQTLVAIFISKSRIMKRMIMTAGAAGLLALGSLAQQKEGSVIYERTTQVQMRLME